MIRNKINNTKYIGQTIRSDINDRWKQEKSCSKRQIGQCLYNAFMKYGIENFEFKIICICFNEDCDKLEEFYINKYNTMRPNGYNILKGGKSYIPTIEAKKKMSESNKGRKLTPEQYEKFKQHIEKHKITLMGAGNPNYGKKISDEQKAKTRMTLLSIERKIKILNKCLDKYILSDIERNNIIDLYIKFNNEHPDKYFHKSIINKLNLSEDIKTKLNIK